MNAAPARPSWPSPQAPCPAPSCVFASVGADLGSILARGGTLTAAGVLTTQVLTAHVGLALLSVVPVAYKRLKARRVP